METIIVCFRRDLRISDNPALSAAKQHAVIPVYIHTPHEEAPWPPGAASRWWLHHSLSTLDAQLQKLGSRLLIREGESLAVLQQLIEDTGASAVYCNRLYEPATIRRDKQIEAELTRHGIEYKSFAGHLLFEPWQVQTGGGTPYKVFTPFWNACQKTGLPSNITQAVRKLPTVDKHIKSAPLTALGLLPDIKWDAEFYAHWQPGAAGAQIHLREFIKQRIADYEHGRDYPAQSVTSRLSPHLHFGEISPRQIVYAIERARETNRSVGFNKQAQGFLRELVWREFTHHILYHFPHTTDKPLNPRFENFPWQTRKTKALAAWQQGRTGFPIVDAGMRELWATGSMHNRVRMIVGSLLTKNLGLHWRHGARWFWDTLVDSDLAQNSFNWQWVAGCGADAAPYFRIFNPITQSEKFDAHGEYLRRWLPELKNLPNKYIHAPWLAPDEVLQNAGVILGRNYPRPVVDLKQSRERALEDYKQHGK